VCPTLGLCGARELQGSFLTKCKKEELFTMEIVKIYLVQKGIGEQKKLVVSFFRGV